MTAIARATGSMSDHGSLPTEFPPWSTKSSGSTTARPSGMDNTVIAYGQPVYFVRGQPPQPFAIGRPFTLVIADSGIASPTKIAVGDVRRAWERERRRFEALFDRVAAIVEAARTAIAAGRAGKAGAADGRQPRPAAGDRRLVPGVGCAGRRGAGSGRVRAPSSPAAGAGAI